MWCAPKIFYSLEMMTVPTIYPIPLKVKMMEKSVSSCWLSTALMGMRGPIERMMLPMVKKL